MKFLTLISLLSVLAVGLVAQASAASGSGISKASAVAPSDECAVAPVAKSAKAAVADRFVALRKSVAARTNKAMLAVSRPLCGGGGVVACNQWVPIWGVGGVWYIFVPC